MKVIRYKKEFLKKFKALPKDVQQKYAALEKIFAENPFHPHLQTKGLHGKLRDFYSFRIGRSYRAIFAFISENEIGMITIGHRKDIYQSPS
ncbi:MAG: type II toxin-antitoxin system mRNA interferase toxin, RelE/StbE family [Candidatus Peregrinibacteria bacterium]|nr:type II toxin-antitoxin system mRNA interferase toxin, RelE/StbE family [Candidatus Peregrinibacteria bacterium]